VLESMVNIIENEGMLQRDFLRQLDCERYIYSEPDGKVGMNYSELLPEFEYKDRWRPDSLLSVVKLGKDETSWNRMLNYFLDPIRSPFETDMLELFLEKLRDDGKIDIEDFDRDKIKQELGLYIRNGIGL